MFEQVLQDTGSFQLAMYRLGRGMRRLLAIVEEWWMTRRVEDTSIAWEDGEPGKDCRHEFSIHQGQDSQWDGSTSPLSQRMAG